MRQQLTLDPQLLRLELQRVEGIVDQRVPFSEELPVAREVIEAATCERVVERPQHQPLGLQFDIAVCEVGHCCVPDDIRTKDERRRTNRDDRSSFVSGPSSCGYGP